ncbi:dihydroneopterin aldolase [Lichenibacterium minor]|uniref:dihydroneopterin aldolase n=1 Tax=Lichenibacterium minor TaxID=2316528 RepID=UPI0013EE1259|nr:dihydroneopterin aldolase [Lichenibacterium minor]
MSSFPSLRAALLSNDEAARVIVFEDIELQVRIGAYESERHAPQRVRVSAELLVVPAAPLGADRLAEVVDYDAIHRDIAALAGAPHVDLQETLAERVAALCLKPRDVAAVEVYVRKVDVYPDCRSVGIRVLRTRRDA